jgi:thiosulfate reductase cytochrome b subunit
MHSEPATTDRTPIHPAWLRIAHWLNALAVLVLVTSGWRIYNAARFFPFEIPPGLTLGGWLGGALQWHFAAMWLLACQRPPVPDASTWSQRPPAPPVPADPPAPSWRDLGAALHGKLSHADPRHYNSVQRLAYVFVMVDSIVLVLSGLVLWKSVQFPLLRELLGGYEGARRVHFAAMAGCAPSSPSTW